MSVIAGYMDPSVPPILLVVAVSGVAVSAISPIGWRARLVCCVTFVILGIASFLTADRAFPSLGDASLDEWGLALLRGLAFGSTRLAVSFGLGLVAGSLLIRAIYQGFGSRPVVRRWFTPFQAMDEFVDQRIVDEFRAAREKRIALGRTVVGLAAQADASSKPITGKLAPIAVGARPYPDHPPEPRVGQAEVRSLADVEMRKRNNMIEDLRQQLGDGRLIGRALRVRRGAIDATKTLISRDLWSVLQFDDYLNGMNSVSYQKWKFCGLEIGKNLKG